MIEPLRKIPRARERDQADSYADRHWIGVCKAVEFRDGYECRCCHQRVVKTIRLQGNRMEHHHVIPKSLGGADDVFNVAILCKACHDDRHVTRQLHIHGNAEKLLTFEKDGRTWGG